MEQLITYLIIYREFKSNLMNLINLLGLLGVEDGDKSAFFLNFSGNFREEARRDLPVFGVEQFEKSSSLIVRLIHVLNYATQVWCYTCPLVFGCFCLPLQAVLSFSG